MEGGWLRSTWISFSDPQAQTPQVASNGPPTLYIEQRSEKRATNLYAASDKGSKVQPETFFFSKTILLPKPTAWGHATTLKEPLRRTGHCLYWKKQYYDSFDLML